MREFLAIGLAAFFIGCANEKEVVAINPPDAVEVVTETIDEEAALAAGTNNDDPNIDGKPQRPYKIQGEIGEISSKESDPFQILSAKIIGNKLFIEISYTGGCGMHNFRCFGNEAISKSIPPQRAIKLVHDNGDDTCKSIVKQTIEVDINPFAYSLAGRSEIVLLLDGYSQHLTYINE
jgi:hypothetical protein